MPSTTCLRSRATVGTPTFRPPTSRPRSASLATSPDSTAHRHERERGQRHVSAPLQTLSSWAIEAVRSGLVRRLVGWLPVTLLGLALVVSVGIGLSLSQGASTRSIADQLGCHEGTRSHPQPG